MLNATNQPSGYPSHGSARRNSLLGRSTDVGGGRSRGGPCKRSSHDQRAKQSTSITTGAGAAGTEYREEFRPTWWNVFATVRDKHNQLLPNLTKDDFKIFEDGAEQKGGLLFRRSWACPSRWPILMDTSGSMYNIMDAEKDAGSRFVREIMHKQDEALVISFDTDVNLLADFTEDPAVLSRAMRRASVNVDASGIGGTGGTVNSQGGGTNLYDAVYLACHDELGSEVGTQKR